VHYGSIERDTAAWKTLVVLRKYPGGISNWVLMMKARVVAVSTRVSELRAQGCVVKHTQVGNGHYYRLVSEPARKEGA
jgi:hypothetical protein